MVELGLAPSRCTLPEGAMFHPGWSLLWGQGSASGGALAWRQGLQEGAEPGAGRGHLWGWPSPAAVQPSLLGCPAGRPCEYPAPGSVFPVMSAMSRAPTS